MCVGGVPVDVFDVLSEHLSMCGVERRTARLKEQRR